jgi:hypothetical protein
MNEQVITPSNCGLAKGTQAKCRYDDDEGEESSKIQDGVISINLFCATSIIMTVSSNRDVHWGKQIITKAWISKSFTSFHVY